MKILSAVFSLSVVLSLSAYGCSTSDVAGAGSSGAGGRTAGHGGAGGKSGLGGMADASGAAGETNELAGTAGETNERGGAAGASEAAGQGGIAESAGAGGEAGNASASRGGAGLAGLLALGDLTMTTENTHVVGGTPCATGFSKFGSASDCGNVNCYGNQNFCEKTVDASAFPSITALTLTPEGTHLVGGIPCPLGSELIGSVSDCGGGTCFGNQLLCATKQLALAGTEVYTAMWMTPEGTHVAGGGGCPAGYSEIGRITDCGGAQCAGDQLICAQKQML